MPTIETAMDDVLGTFKTAWETAGGASEISTGVYVEVYWPDTDSDPPVDTSTDWVRVTLGDLADGKHAGIGNGTGRYLKRGSIIFQLFTRRGKGIARRTTMSDQIVSAYDGKRSANDVVFTETQARSVGESGGWSQTNITVFFEFEEFK